MATSTTTVRPGRRRAAVALAGLVAFVGLGVATATTASATERSRSCYVEVYYGGVWHKVKVQCA
ncbi:hypothetical protein ACIQOW_37420 [Kitasatospora sp. NPDC091335]|uniref:hypothetical protein n=1 Tax=Streptomycetaceae TaxID=2062 RepID=UPI0016619F3F|nr:hypothetical protein [Streptomyces sp. CBMA156]MBD0669318.1 hypothetical protein [Streptomyces sp. CBMA156]